MLRGQGGVTLHCNADSDQYGPKPDLEHGLDDHDEVGSVPNSSDYHTECEGCKRSSKYGGPSYAF